MTKRANLSQEVIRCLLNTSQVINHKVKEDIIRDFITKLKTSGYIRTQIREILRSVVVGFITKLEPRRYRHRRGKETEPGRRLKKLTDKSSWFRLRDTRDSHRLTRQTDTKGNRVGQKHTSQKRPSTVLFVERTNEGALVTSIKAKEKELNIINMKKVKIVEKNSQQVQQMVTDPDPWGTKLCGRLDCLPCAGVEEGKINVVYKSR